MIVGKLLRMKRQGLKDDRRIQAYKWKIGNEENNT